MKRLLTENIGLKIVSVLASFILWLVVVNVDDPVINRTYSGIPVEIINENIVTDAGKYYDIVGNDTISVVVSAKRSVLDSMSRDYIRAVADMKQLSLSNTLPIEVRTTRYADAVESVNSRTTTLQLRLEDIIEKRIPLTVEVSGEVAPEHLLSTVTPKYDEVVLKGPESEVNEVSKAVCEVDVSSLSADESLMVPIQLLDGDDYIIESDNLKLSNSNMSVNIVIWATKEIPVYASVSGKPLDGYSMIGNAAVNPESVVITGRSAYLGSMTAITIPGEDVSIQGASDVVEKSINIKKLLPEGIMFADENFDGDVNVTVLIEQNEHKTVEVPTANISIINVPEGYSATLVDVGEILPVEIQGKGEAYDKFDGSIVVGVIDALSLVPRNAAVPSQTLHTGSNDGHVLFTLPDGITEMAPVYMEVIIEHAPAN